MTKKLYIPILTLLLALLLVLGVCNFTFVSVAEAASWTTAQGGAVEGTNTDTQLRPGSSYRYGEEINAWEDGFKASFQVNGSFRRQDVWFALLLQTQYGEGIGDYSGLNFQFKPVSADAAAQGQMPVYVSAYNRGKKEGGEQPSYQVNVSCTTIAESETPFTFNISLCRVDKTWILSYCLDTFTYRWELSALSGKSLKLSLIFGGADAANSDIGVVIKQIGKAKEGGFFSHASNLSQTDDGVRFAETSKRQAKAIYPVAMSSKKEIEIPFKINNSPVWAVNDNGDSWFGILLSSSPNACLPGSSTFGVIIRAHEDFLNGIQHVGGQFFLNGAYLSGFATGTDTNPVTEFNYLRIAFHGEEATITLEGAGIRSQTVSVPSYSFPEGVAWLSFAFNDDQRASIVQTNEFGEEEGRTPNPDLSYWDVTLGEISEVGAPEVLNADKEVNAHEGERVRIPIRTYGSKINQLQVLENGAFVPLTTSDYSIRNEGDILTVYLSKAFTQRMGLGKRQFKILSSHEIAAYDANQTQFELIFVDAIKAEGKTLHGEYRSTAEDDVKLSLTMNDDRLLSISGNGITSSDYFHNPVTGNVYLKREFLRNLGAGEYIFSVECEFSTHEFVVVCVDDTPQAGGSGCGASVSAVVYPVVLLVGVALTLIKRKKV